MIFRVTYSVLILILILSDLFHSLWNYKKKPALFFRFKKKLFQQIKKRQEKGTILVHAVSVGEVKLACSIIEVLRRVDKNQVYILTVITDTGYAFAKSHPKVFDEVYFMPFDFFVFTDRLFWQTKPRLLLLIEGDFWPSYLRSSHKHGCVSVVLNGKISERSYRRYMKAQFVGKTIFPYVHKIFTQDENYSGRFEGIASQNCQIETSLNLKLCKANDSVDVQMKKQIEKWGNGKPIVSFVSTHRIEDGLAADFYRFAEEKGLGIKVLVAPRHLNRGVSIQQLFEEIDQEKLFFTHGALSHDSNVMVMDKIGLMNEVLSNTTISIVCGTFDEKIGGHNLLEPCQFGVPVVYGPHTHAQSYFHHKLKQSGAGVQVKDGEELKEALVKFLDDEGYRSRKQANCRNLSETELEGAQSFIKKKIYEEYINENRQG